MLHTDILDGLEVVGVAVALFAMAFIVHVVVWRTRRPIPSSGALISLFIAVIAAEGLALAAGSAIDLVPFSAGSVVIAVAQALQLAACYVISYPAMQANSPSLVMSRELSAACSRGLARAELYARLSEAALVSERIDDLLRDALVVGNDLLTCTTRGAVLARAAGAWKKFLGEPKGG